MKKNVASLLFCAAFTVFLGGQGTTAQAGTWKSQRGSWYYTNDAGQGVRSSWQYINRSWYAFEGGGRMRTGWYLDGGKWYYLEKSNGYLLTGWQHIGNFWYYLDASQGGALAVNTTVQGKYLVNERGEWVEGNTADDASLARFKEQVVNLVNAERTQRGLEPLRVSASLGDIASIRAEELVTSFSHTRPNGTSCFTLYDEKGYDYSSAGENIALGQTTPESVMKGWMDSQGHRENILSPNFTEIGVGVYRDSSGRMYWAQNFAS